MPANKKKDTIPQRNGATSNGVLSTHQPLLEDFHQYVRSEIRHATRMVMEEIMCEELSSLSSSQMGRMYPLPVSSREPVPMVILWPVG